MLGLKIPKEKYFWNLRKARITEESRYNLKQKNYIKNGKLIFRNMKRIIKSTSTRF